MANFLYNTAFGRFILKIVTLPWLSKLAGAFLSSGISRIFIRGFVKKNGIDLSECESTDFKSFNDCFTRKLKADLRPVDTAVDALISPCDGLLSAYEISDSLVLPVKQSRFSVKDLLGDGKLAEKFDGGSCLVFRLQVHDYHRYIFFDSGTVTESKKIAGRLHTVRPIALRSVPVFTENSREITVIESDFFGLCTQIEVGAMMVGKISNHPLNSPRIQKAAEKGMFLFGGSTIIILLQKGFADGLSEALNATSNGIETPVKLGQRLN